MKVLLTLMLVSLLLACSKKEGDLTLSCYGTNAITTAGKTTNTDETHQYVFVGKKLEGYDCEWSDKTILCYDSKDDAEKRNSNHLLYERATGSFTQLHTTKTNTSNNLVERALFIGHCGSPIFH